MHHPSVGPFTREDGGKPVGRALVVKDDALGKMLADGCKDDSR